MWRAIEKRELKADVLIIGGGTAGCFAALTLARLDPELDILIAEKAQIRRSGCLAAGVNALNAYITPGHEPSDYAEYAMRDAAGIARWDLLLSMSRRLNAVTEDLEKLGLVILKDKEGKYVCRGARNIKINGENIKPILSDAVTAQKNIRIAEHLNLTDLIVKDGRVKGAVGHDTKEPVLFRISSRAVLIATGGAAGLYLPNHPGQAGHKMWYCPFNTGAGYAMGIRAGAEMTTFEMRFIALRCSDTIAPTGTLAQGVGAKQINALGEEYESRYGLTTSQRIWGTVRETQEGRGPCYLKTSGISKQQEQDLEKAYLNMAPSQTLKWVEEGIGPSGQDVQIEGTEPYVVGGHTASGYWIDENRRTTLCGLYAAGDVAGGCPQKYVTGALAEGQIAAETILEDLPGLCHEEATGQEFDVLSDALEEKLNAEAGISPWELEIRMQQVMDRYAGGISRYYGYTKESLAAADEKIRELKAMLFRIRCEDMRAFTAYQEVRERLDVCSVLIAHLNARKETRWHCFAENESYPQRDDDRYLQFINSVAGPDGIRILYREIGGQDEYTGR